MVNGNEIDKKLAKLFIAVTVSCCVAAGAALAFSVCIAVIFLPLLLNPDSGGNVVLAVLTGLAWAPGLVIFVFAFAVTIVGVIVFTYSAVTVGKNYARVMTVGYDKTTKALEVSLGFSVLLLLASGFMLLFCALSGDIAYSSIFGITTATSAGYIVVNAVCGKRLKNKPLNR